MVNIYVGNLPYGISDAELESAFGAYGAVERAKVITDRETGRSRGFGFVEMPNDDEARAAMEALNGEEMSGRKLVVNEARPRR
jgi:RNA recognition motif-containing protein